jgi:hypothetical protein
MNWWLCPWRILETVTSSLETFSIVKEKKFNPEYNTDIKHSGLLFHNDTSQWYLSQAFWEPNVQVCTIYTFEVELYTII